MEDTFEVLADAQIEQLNKPNLQKYTRELSQAYKKMYHSLFDPDSGIIPKLESQIAIVSNTNSLLLKKLADVERTSIGNAQYSRKETIELHGFDPKVNDNEIEAKVINIVNAIKNDDEQDITADDIQACHKLKNKKNVICKFVKRKRMRAVVYNRKKMKNKDLKEQGIPGGLFIVESMAPAFRSIDWKCRMLKKAEKIKQCWFFNGSYNIQLLNEEKKKVGHNVDLEEILLLTAEEIDAICVEMKGK